MRNFRLDDESGHQETLFSWAAYRTEIMPELQYMYHVPNGGKRDKATAAVLKRQGVKAGVPDIMLPAARAGYHGLYIELKAGENTTTKKQKEWLEYLRQQGYYTAMLRSGAGVQEICNSVYRESEVASVAHKERVCAYWHCSRTGGTECWNWGSRYAGKKCPQSDACEHWRTCEMCNGVMGQCKKKQRIEKAR
jgi:hypothetical protein